MDIPDLTPDENYVIYGVRRLRTGFGYAVARSLKKKRLSFYIVHPTAHWIGEWQPARNVNELPVVPDAAVLCSPKEQGEAILKELHDAGVRRVYAAPGSIDEKARTYATAHEMELYEECPLLHVSGLGFPHNLHRFLVRLFRRS